MERLRDNLKYRIELEGENSSSALKTRLSATEETLTQLHELVALDDPLVRAYYEENLRALIPSEIPPAGQVPEQVRETAALVEAAGAIPADAEGHFLRANALYLSSERLEGKAIAQALKDAIKAYDRAMEVYTREAHP